MKAITCSVVITGASSRVDGSLSLRLSTPELEPNEKTVFFEVLNKPLKMLLQPDGDAPVELKEIKGEFDKKSPSVRLRNVLYILHKQQESELPFDEWYIRRMNKIIDEHKAMLAPE
jgi:hypothetical protein